MNTAKDDDCRLALIKPWQPPQVERMQLRKIAGGGSPAAACFEPRGPPESSCECFTH